MLPLIAGVTHVSLWVNGRLGRGRAVAGGRVALCELVPVGAGSIFVCRAMLRTRDVSEGPRDPDGARREARQGDGVAGGGVVAISRPRSITPPAPVFPRDLRLRPISAAADCCVAPQAATGRLITDPGACLADNTCCLNWNAYCYLRSMLTLPLCGTISGVRRVKICITETELFVDR